MSNLYLIRHGIAADRGTYQDDEQRPLTPEGDRKTRQVALTLKQLKIQFHCILSSPLVRARQTAEILQSTGLSFNHEILPALAPDGDIQQWLDWYGNHDKTREKDWALVGHQPDLGNWAEYLIWKKSEDVLIVKKAGIIGIKIPKQGMIQGNSRLFWLTAPKFLLGLNER
ncbi:MAG: phosphohistidine phosphatase SixA [Arthrospira sp. PLM2.Bin9]|nr:phosphohistidine phosphatase SixA [Arthrospira sp. PLM2.Bin9]TVU53841.1 MAG: phosphohistidine phosphatase SixA [Arthrospira sp. PLM2.Bin9]